MKTSHKAVCIVFIVIAYGVLVGTALRHREAVGSEFRTQASPTNALSLQITNESTNFVFSGNWTTGSITAFLSTNMGFALTNFYDRGTNFMTVTNSLRFGFYEQTLVICVTPDQWNILTNHYPKRVSHENITFYSEQ